MLHHQNQRTDIVIKETDMSLLDEMGLIHLILLNYDRITMFSKRQYVR